MEVEFKNFNRFNLDLTLVKIARKVDICFALIASLLRESIGSGVTWLCKSQLNFKLTLVKPIDSNFFDFWILCKFQRNFHWIKFLIYHTTWKKYYVVSTYYSRWEFNDWKYVLNAFVAAEFWDEPASNLRWRRASSSSVQIRILNVRDKTWLDFQFYSIITDKIVIQIVVYILQTIKVLTVRSEETSTSWNRSESRHSSEDLNILHCSWNLLSKDFSSSSKMRSKTPTLKPSLCILIFHFWPTPNAKQFWSFPTHVSFQMKK